MAYGTIATADTYFTTRLHVYAWNESTTAQKQAALTDSVRRIDRLRFSGYQVDEAQDEEFPRYYGDEPVGDEAVPEDIKIACYECAFALLDGVDPELELENQAVSSQGVSSVRSTYARGEAVEHIAAGIPSAYAWRFLKPYLSNSNTIRLRRVS